MEETQSNDGKAIAILVRNDYKKDGVNFISKTNFPLQVALSSYKKGYRIKAHIHRGEETTSSKTQEMLYVARGEMLVTLYDSNKETVKSFKVFSGDLIFFIGGGHGFEILEDTKIIEVKQGPYLGKDKDKVLIE